MTTPHGEASPLAARTHTHHHRRTLLIATMALMLSSLSIVSGDDGPMDDAGHMVVRVDQMPPRVSFGKHPFPPSIGSTQTCNPPAHLPSHKSMRRDISGHRNVSNASTGCYACSTSDCWIPRDLGTVGMDQTIRGGILGIVYPSGFSSAIGITDTGYTSCGYATV